MPLIPMEHQRSEVRVAAGFFGARPPFHIPGPDEMGEQTIEEAVAANQTIWDELLQIYADNNVNPLGYLVEAIWDKLALFFVPAADAFSFSLATMLDVGLEKALRFFRGWAENEGFIPSLARSMRELREANTYDDIMREIDEFSREHPIVSFPLIAAITVGNFTGFMAAAMGAKHEKIAQGAMIEERPALPSVGDLLELKWKAQVDGAEIIDVIRRLGFPEKFIAKFLIASETPITPLEIAELFNRGDIGDAKADELMERNRLGAEQRALLKKLFKPIPPVTDMVRFAVREAFSPEIVTRFKLDEDFPEEFERQAAKLGITTEWAKAYWRSHWDLPSISAGYEMLHRGIIDEEELMVLLRTKDVMPHWRDRLMKISFSPYTRVDIRRMHAEGILNETEVYKAYQDIGYDDDHAQHLADFTVKLNQDDARETTKTDIIGAYRRGLMGRAEALQMLGDIGYGDDLREMIVLREDFDIAGKERKANTAVIRKGYIAGRIDRNEALVRLSSVDIVGAQAEGMLADWELERKEKTAEVTFAQLVDMLKFGIIDRGTLTHELTEKGYHPVEVDRLVELAVIKSRERS